MCAKSTFPNYDSPSRRSSMYHLRFPRNAKRMDINDAKLALDIIIRPSLQLWKQALGRSGILTTLKRPKKSASFRDSASSTSSISLKKKVRFDDKPVTISRRNFFERWRKDSYSSPARPCLILRENGDTHQKSPNSPLETDCPSIYEDCLCDYPDLEVFECNQHLGTRWPKRIRRSEFYQMESGIAMFDQAGYASYCLSRWLERQRKEARGSEKRVFEDPAFLSQPDHTLPLLPPASSDQVDVTHPVPPLPVAFCRPIRSLPGRIYKYVEDELQNAIVILVIGGFIHICLFFFLVYDILTRGFIPSDD